MIIRRYQKEDKEALLALYPMAFPEEDLLPLLNELLDEKDTVSFIANAQEKIAGHLAITYCSDENGDKNLCLLGPIAVDPHYQKSGIGSALIKTAIEHLKEKNIDKLLVLGDPKYYTRFSFEKEDYIRAPYPLPAEWLDAWMSLNLNKSTEDIKGTLVPPGCWLKKELWL
jgi:putative acetyltransferase